MMTRYLSWITFARKLFPAALAAILSAALPASAAIIGFQNLALFNAASSGWTKTTTNFDSTAAGTTYAAGTGPAGSGFTMTLGGVDAGSNVPAVNNQFWTTSGTNYLGLNNGDGALEQGDTLTFNFLAPVRAFGFFAIGSSDVIAGDYTLATGADSIGNSGIAALTDPSNGSFAYFLGFVADGPGESFSSVSFSVADRGLLFGLPTSLDDIVVAAVSDSNPEPVPEPGSVALMLIGLLGFSALAQRRFR
ncbi:PEP-CTERM sorting domain-containing protein [Undibacterium sp.]|uniref:PEP-CTERM sorting domain-containing protein n=1 Tax=Undibacterium sp. TaxID=1914977 RepID=UPI002CA0B72A|nr:PEP-CTERM sorting domain-containing protein [Undibacterium sp.]HTD04891.1 PEP-CTERM sorting domain-containing protein [Undibacterium sp.]